MCLMFFFFFSSRRRHTRLQGDWSSDVCSSDLISDKVSYFITDNASYMRAAFSVKFPSESSADSSEAGTGNEDLFEDNTDESVELIDTERLACFAHSLQLAIGDGMKETKSVSAALSKSVAVSNILHRSTLYKVCEYS